MSETALRHQSFALTIQGAEALILSPLIGSSATSAGIDKLQILISSQAESSLPPWFWLAADSDG
jgi:hypothetical protein